MQGSPAEGARYLIRGFKMLRHTGIRRYVWIPLFINIAIFSSLTWYGVDQFNAGLDYLTGFLPDWLDFLQWLLWPIFIVLLLVIVFYTFTVIANLLAAPFNGLLAESIQLAETGRPAPSATENWQGALRSLPHALLRELRKLAHTLPRALLIWIITLIPGLNAIAPFLWFLWGAWMMVIQYTDFPIDNNRLGFADVRRLAAAQRLTSLGFGAAVLGATMIPVLNLFVMPAAVCGATLYWCESLAQVERTR